MKGKIKRIYKGNYWYLTLYLHGFRFNEIIESFRKINLFDNKEERKPNEIFLTIELEKKNFYFYVKPTKEFKEFMKKHLLSYPTFEPSIEIIQQRKIVNNKEKWLKECLVLVNEGNFIGDVKLDYKSLKEVLEFFRLKHE